MSFTHTDDQLNAMFDEIPALSGRPRRLEDLPGGLTNRNVRIVTPDGEFVARCTDPGADALGIDRDQEHQNTRAAEAAGVGAPVVDYRPDLGILVIGYIDGTTLANEDFDRPGVVARVARSCRQLHAGPRFHGEFNMFERQRSYLETVERNGYTIPADYRDHAEAIQRIRAALATQDQGTVPCNNDLLAANFIDDGQKIWLIDYEYAGNNDPCFELGNVWSECRLSLDQLEELVTVYYGEPLRNRVARARLQGIVSKYGWTLWGCIQNATSPLDFDFWEWAMERYDGAMAELSGPDLPALLSDVERSD
ncbi:MAG: phosphotransferase [Nocardioidaceae bacterium]